MPCRASGDQRLYINEIANILQNFLFIVFKEVEKISEALANKKVDGMFIVTVKMIFLNSICMFYRTNLNFLCLDNRVDWVSFCARVATSDIDKRLFYFLFFHANFFHSV